MGEKGRCGIGLGGSWIEFEKVEGCELSVKWVGIEVGAQWESVI